MLVAIAFLAVAGSATLTKDENMELLLVHVVWRHGDRSPIKICPNDPVKEEQWTFGGGGLGQLTTLGMKQHFLFGKQLRRRYIDSNYLGRRYSSKEIYVRSTAKNRTIVSAMANMLGMYYRKGGETHEKDVDFPGISGWPSGYVPIPVHSVDRSTDYVGIPDLKCDHRQKLWNTAKTMDEVKTYLESPEVLSLFEASTKKCGKKIDEKNIWEIRDTMSAERAHYGRLDSSELSEWLSEEFYRNISKIDNQIILYMNGIFNKPIIKNGIDIGLEIQKSRGGPLFNEIYDRMKMKVDCLNNLQRPQCSWIKDLKYYVYSAHDSTVSSIAAILGIHKKVIRSVNPAYASAVLIELFHNTTNKLPYFKLFYRQDAGNQKIHPITGEIDECKNETYCSLDVFQKYANITKIDQPMETWCQMDPWNPRTSVAASWWFSQIAVLMVSYIWFYG